MDKCVSFVMDVLSDETCTSLDSDIARHRQEGQTDLATGAARGQTQTHAQASIKRRKKLIIWWWRGRVRNSFEDLHGRHNYDLEFRHVHSDCDAEFRLFQPI